MMAEVNGASTHIECGIKNEEYDIKAEVEEDGWIMMEENNKIPLKVKTDDIDEINTTHESRSTCSEEASQYADDCNIGNEGQPIKKKKVQEDTQELRKLLADWNQEFLVDHFVAQKVFVNVLKIMKHHHIERLLKNFKLGTQIVFEHKLEEWRTSIGMPLVYHGDMSLTPSSLPPATSCVSRASTPPGEPHFKNPSDARSDDCNIYLCNILNETPKGAMLVVYYNKFLKFQDEQRTSLINLIAQFFEDKGVPMTLATSYRLEREILMRFATEKLEYYRSSKRGRIYNKFCNLKTSFKTAVGKHFVDETPKKKPSKKCRLETDFEPEDNSEACLRALRLESLTHEQFCSTWQACSKHRLNDLKSLGNTAAVMEKWSFYKNPIGYRLIEMDFNAAFGNGDGLLKNWNQCFNRLLQFLSNENHVKDKNIKALLEHLKTNDSISENSRTACLLWALHGYFVPTNKIVKKDEDCGKNKTTKFAIKDSQESFLFVGKCAQEIEDHINHLKQTKQNIQPFIYCIGDSIFTIEDIYIFFDNIRFKIFNFLRAVDVCFKIFYVFGIDFPTESSMFYSFIETYFFKLKSHQKFSKVFILAEHLDSAE